MQNRNINHSLHLFVLTCGLLGLAAQARSADTALSMETHAAFFSSETKQKAPLDPQVFLSAPDGPAAVGPQGIRHEAGLRPALIADKPTLPVMNAKGESLGMTLGSWLSAKGTVVLTTQANGTKKSQLSFQVSSPKENTACLRIILMKVQLVLPPWMGTALTTTLSQTPRASQL